MSPVGTTGAGVWSTPAIDTQNRIVYVGTGNAGNKCSPPSLVPMADSIVALNMSSGAVLNYHQVNIADTLDLDFGSSPVLTFTRDYNFCKAQNTVSQVVVEANKNGTLYSIPRGPGGLESVGYAPSLTTPANATFIASPAAFETTTFGPAARLPGQDTSIQLRPSSCRLRWRRVSPILRRCSAFCSRITGREFRL